MRGGARPAQNVPGTVMWFFSWTFPPFIWQEGHNARLYDRVKVHFHYLLDKLHESSIIY